MSEDEGQTFISGGVTINAEMVTIAGDVVGRDKREGTQGEKTPPPFQLPSDLPSFAGREKEITALDELLKPGTGTTVALVGLRGMAGVGKSALAIHAAHQWRERFPDGVVWVDLRRGDAESGLRHIAASLGSGQNTAQAPSIADLAALVRSILRDKRALIILDNAENVPAADFDYLLPGATNCAIAVTSRRTFPALEKHGRVLRVDTLDEPEALDLLAGVLGQNDAELPERKQLCARLGFLPLALDIAARRMKDKGWSAAEMLARLEDQAQRLAELDLPLAEAPEESVTLAFALSYQALKPEDARIFRALGVFASGFTPASVAGVLALPDARTAERALDNLATVSLVRPTARSGRHDLHPLLADYARSLATTADELSTLHRAHAAFFLAYAQQFEQDFDALESELPNLLGAMDWADEARRLENGDYSPHSEAERGWRLEAARVVTGMTWAIDSIPNGLLFLRGYWSEAKRRLAQAAEAARQIGDADDEAAFIGNAAIVAQDQGDVTGARAELERVKAIFEKVERKDQVAVALHQLAMLAQATGDLAEARRLYEQSLAINRELGNKQGIASTLGQLAMLAQATGDLAEARRLYNEAGRIFDELGAKKEQATLLHQFAMLAQDTGDLAEARRLYQQSLQLERELGDKQGIASTLHNLAMLAQDTGDLAEARRLYDQSLQLKRELGDKQGIVGTLHQLGRLAQDTGDLAEARRLYDQSLQLKRELGDKRGIANTLHQLGTLSQATGDLAEARRLYNQSLQLKRELGDKQGIANTLGQLGNLESDVGEIEKARAHYAECLSLFRELGDKRGIAITQHQLGPLAQDTGDLAESRRLYEQSLQLARELGDKQGIASTLHQLATLAQDTGDLAEARRLYDQSLQIERELGDKQGIASTLHQLGRLAEDEGNLAEAARLFEESLKMLTELGSPGAKVARSSLERVRQRMDSG